MTNTAQTCASCRWYVASQGECRRHAPIFHEACGSIFPQNMQDNDFCGEHTPKEPPHAG